MGKREGQISSPAAWVLPQIVNDLGDIWVLDITRSSTAIAKDTGGQSPRWQLSLKQKDLFWHFQVKAGNRRSLYYKVLILGYFDVVFPAYAFRGPHQSQKYAHKMDFELSISYTHTVHKKVPNANGNSRIFRIFRIANITYKSLIALPLNLLKIRFGSTGSV